MPLISTNETEPPDYYNCFPKEDVLRVHQLWDYIKTGLSNDRSKFVEEFKVKTYNILTTY